MRNILLTILFMLVGSQAWGATIVAATGAAGNWTSGGAWVGGVAPTASDDAQITVSTTSITINAGAVARSADFTGFTGTLTQGSTGTLTLGDATAGLTNIALKIPSGATYAPNASSTISFISTSATQQTIAVDSGYTLGNVTINSASNGNYAIITTGLTISVTSTLTLTKGTLHTDGASDNSGLTHSWGLFSSTASNTRNINLGNSTIGITGASANVWNMAGSGMSFTAGTSTINFTGDTASMIGGAFNYNIVNFTGSGTPTLDSNGSGNYGTLTRTGTAVKTDAFTLWNSLTVTGVFSVTGQSVTNRVFYKTGSLGTPKVLTLSGATISTNNVDFRDITFARSDSGALDLSAGQTNSVGDCGGNSKTLGDSSTLTFTTPATQTWSGTSGGNWSTNAWSGRVPLPQDNVLISSVFTSGQAVHADMPRIGKSIDFSGSSWSGSATVFSLDNPITLYGSLIMKLGMASNGNQGITFEGRNTTYTFTSGGITWASGITISMIGGTLNLGDAYSSNPANNAQPVITDGTFNASGFTVSCSRFSVSGSNTRSVILGSGTWTLANSANGNVWVATTTTGLTFNSSGSTIAITDTGSNPKTFIGGGLTYNNLSTPSGTGGVAITGANTFNNITVAAGGKLTLPSTVTNTVSSFTAIGSSGNVITLNASTGGSAATLTKNGGGTIQCEWCDITDVNVTPSSTWYYGNHSSYHSGTGWNTGEQPNFLPFFTMIFYNKNKQKMVLSERLSFYGHGLVSCCAVCNV